ncbi:MAG: prepilin peptidase, partial [Alphaproteobacteria bacterium]|nr:prepilin peptidase [Alphaproteobacteria bacterium]
RMAKRADAEGAAVAGLTDRGLREAAEALRAPLLREGFRPALVARAFAIAREASHRHLGLRHHMVQLMGGWALLDGRLTEMSTGEGKTLTAILPTFTAALAGVPVHVVTVNEYLSARDAAYVRPLFTAFGLSVGLCEPEQDRGARRAAYACDVTYCTNKDVVFDYLRDRLAIGAKRAGNRIRVGELFGGGGRESGQLVLRGLHYAIVDEADSVLIDEARTPLIISGTSGRPEDAAQYHTALDVARRLVLGRDFTISANERSVIFTPAGETRLAELARGLPGLWVSRRAREEIVQQALSATHLFDRDRHYIIADEKIQIVDEFTGRVMADRSWERGLHQLIEAKENVEVTGRRDTKARITYQRFFRRYLRLAGMTGTAKEVAGEIWSVYGLKVARIPTNRPSRRAHLGRRLFTTIAAKWQAIAETAATMRAQGRAVLIGTRSVAASEELGAVLTQAGLEHVVLNARQDKTEAVIIAGAGQAGRITVATNMAGRGTDIKISPEVERAGGLHVILTEVHESPRIDRQLFGRAARQGDPGSCEVVVSIEDELFQRFVPRLARSAAVAPRVAGRVLGPWAATLESGAQFAAERLNGRIRRATVRSDKKLDKSLAFAGQPE